MLLLEICTFRFDFIAAVGLLFAPAVRARVRFPLFRHHVLLDGFSVIFAKCLRLRSCVVSSQRRSGLAVSTGGAFGTCRIWALVLLAQLTRSP